MQVDAKRKLHNENNSDKCSIVRRGPSHAAGGTSADEKLTPAEAKEIAREAFLWGMHPVAIYHLRFNFAQNELNPHAAGINRLSWNRTPLKALPRVATTPNATTLYGVGMFDLSEEPAVIIVPEIKDHYWSVHLHDNYARWWHMIGSQFNKPGPVRRLLIGPNWSGKLPDGFVGADIVQSQSDFAGVLARVALTDDTEEELQTVNAIQDRITAMSLSQWIAAGRKEVRAEDVPLTKADYPTYPGMEKVREPGKLNGVDFLRWVSLVLNDPSFTKQTDSHREVTALARFERLGLKVGTPFDPAGLTPEIAAAVEAGIEEGKQEVLEGMAANFTEVAMAGSSTPILATKIPTGNGGHGTGCRLFSPPFRPDRIRPQTVGRIPMAGRSQASTATRSPST